MVTSQVIKFSPQQSSFIGKAIERSTSIVLSAVAGAGKTSTVLALAEKLMNTAYVVFNKENEREANAKIAARHLDWKKIQAKTAHGFGLGIFRKNIGQDAAKSLVIDGAKVKTILASIINSEHKLNAYQGMIASLISKAKNQAIGCDGQSIDDSSLWQDMIEHYDMFSDVENGPVPPVQDIITMAKRVIRLSNQNLKTIDFDDMIYLPLVHRMRGWQFDQIILDEAQDTNRATRLLVRAMLRPNGFLYAVGDEFQAIYGFRGADNNALQVIKQEFNAIEMPLSVSFRCSQVAVKLAQAINPAIEPAHNAKLGSTSNYDFNGFVENIAKTCNGDDAILCRNTSPLVDMAFTLLRKRIACKIEGRKGLGDGLINLATRWKRIVTIAALIDKLDEFEATQTVKLRAKKQDAKLDSLVDQIETLRVIIEQCRAEKKSMVADIVAYIDSLFADDVQGMLRLSTIHKSKGREWLRVHCLDWTLCPSPYAKQEWMYKQEKHLQYVALTRTLDQINFIEGNPKLKKAR